MPHLKRFAGFALAVFSLASSAQQVTLSGLRAVNGLGAFHGVKLDSAGNIYTVLDARDGVRVLKFDPTGTQLLAQAQLGTAGDTGLALDLDPAGNVYVAGTSTSSGTLTGTAGTTYPAKTGSSTNSFVARLSSSLGEQWLTFCGSGAVAVSGIAATSTSVLVTGSIFTATLPVTGSGIQQVPASGSSANGFVESFSSAAGTLNYATYLTGAGGDTTPAAIAADANGNAYIAGTTTATGYPTTAVLVPIFRAPGTSTASGFVTKLDAVGDGFLFSTFVPGGGLSSIAVDTAGSGSLLVSGNIAPGLFPLTQVQAPIASSLSYQFAIRMALDGSSVTSATLLAPATESFIAPGTSGSAWIFADANASALAPLLPLLPLLPVETLGNAYALRIGSSGMVDRSARFGGVGLTSTTSANLPVTAGGVAVSALGTPTLAGSAAPTLSSSLLTTEHYDLPLMNAPNAALPSAVRSALPSTCNGSACSGGAGLLAQMTPDATAPSLSLSADGAPNLTLRNLGTAAATGVQVTSSNYSVSTNCGASLAAGAECGILLTGTTAGSITVSSANAGTFTTTLPAPTTAASALVVLPRELDFGIQSSVSAAGTRTLTIANLGTTTQTFSSANISTLATAYALSEANSTCTPASDGVSKVLAAGGSCTITLQLQAAASAASDGVVNARWKVATSEILVTGYGQAAALSLSATTIDFGRQYTGGLRSGRYLYLSNASDAPQTHTRVTSNSASFSVTDECPTALQPRSVCRIVFAYEAAGSPSSDAMTLGIDGLTATVLGETFPQPAIGAATTNPNLSVSPTSITFSNAVAVTSASSETQTVTVGNTGATPFPLALSITGDFTYTTSCGATLAANATCKVVLTFTPTAGGTRQGLLSVTAGTSAPVYVELAGTGTAILPSNNSTVSFGNVPVGTPTVQWFKISQAFPSLTVTSSSPAYSVTLVEDQGYGHGNPLQGSYSKTTTGTCYSCYLGIQFLPTSAGMLTGTISLSSPGGGAPQVINATGVGTPLTGPILTPVAQDFGTVTVHSTSATTLFQLTNGSTGTLGINSVALLGDFTVTAETTGGTTCAGASVAAGASCFIPVRFSPTVSGSRSGTLTVATDQGTVSATMAGTGADDPGLAFSPVAVAFDNVPGTGATQQTVTVTNTGALPATIGSPVTGDTRFSITSNCGVLAAGGTCSVTVGYAATLTAASSSLTVPVTTSPAGAPSTTYYSLPLSGLYTSENSGLQIIPGESSTVNFGPATTGSIAASRVLHLNNLSAKAVDITLETAREFPVTASTCATLAANASCDLTVTYTPMTGGDTTGSLFVTGTPADGSATVNALGYLEGYGTGSGTLQLTAAVSPLGVLSFGQVASGQSSSQVVTLTYPVTAAAGSTVTVRRILAGFPYLTTTTCGSPLTPGQSCTITVTYSPQFQATASTNAEMDTAILTVETDGASSPLYLDMAGQTTPAIVTTPNNTAPLYTYSISQGALTFAPTAAGSASAAQSLMLTNTGTANLHVLKLVTPSSFATTNGCSGVVPAGSSCTISVTFTPQNLGAVAGSLEIQTDSGSSLEFVSLYGIGSQPAANTPTASVAPGSIDFGRVLVGATGAATATVTNTGTVAVTYTGATLSGAPFALASASSGANACAAGASLAAGASCTVAVVFSPAATGTFTGTLSVTTSASQTAMVVLLSGVGTNPQLTVTPISLGFGTVQVGSTSTLALTLRNVSTTPVDGLSFSVTAPYSVATTCGITTINAGSTCSVSVTYAPTTAGTQVGALFISSTDPASPLIVLLTGTGATVPTGSFTLTVNGGSAATATVAAGSPASYALAVTPTGGYTGTVALTCSADTVVQYAACSLVPSTVTLGASTQTAAATISTVAALNSSVTATTSWFGGAQRVVALAFLPFGIVMAYGQRRRKLARLLVLLMAVTLMCGGCGSSNSAVVGGSKTGTVAPGTYTFHVTASSTTAVQVSQTVTLTLVVQ